MKCLRLKYFTAFVLISGIVLFSALVFGVDHPRPPPLEHAEIGGEGVSLRAGLRPFRQGGIRLEVEALDGITLIHDYGHGGAGFTLSLGSVEEALRLAQPELSKIDKGQTQVAVLGGGVIGLSTAYRLLKEGYKVVLYYKERFENTTSMVAGALWSPISVETTQETASLMHQVQSVSYLKFQRLSEENDSHVRKITMYVARDPEHPEIDKSGIEQFRAMGLSITKYERLPIVGVTLPGESVGTFLVDTPLYLKKLFESVAGDSAAEMVQRKFNSREELMAFLKNKSHPVVFNCMGLGSRKIFEDHNLIPVKGQACH